jgi:hypothetical protein
MLSTSGKLMNQYEAKLFVLCLSSLHELFCLSNSFFLLLIETEMSKSYIFENPIFMQALVAINQITKQILDGNPDFFPIKPMDYGRFLVISVGTGSSKAQKKYSAQKAAKWGVFGWLLNGGSTPIVDVFTQASADMVDLHISVVFQAFHSQENYLRIHRQDKVYIQILLI